MRPLTNNNFLLDFHRYEGARYYDVMVRSVFIICLSTIHLFCNH